MWYLKRGFLLLLICCTYQAYSQTSNTIDENKWNLNASYKSDLVTNFNGGIMPGTTFLGLADLYIGYSGLWKGSELLVHGANSHGGEPSANLIGDFQIVSNIEAGNHTFLYELWYKQYFRSMILTVGLQDLNVEFANSDVAGLFLNSSFGIHSVIADNIAAPLFPLTSHGLTLCWHTSENWCLKSAFYKGSPIDFEDNPYNIRWNLNYLSGLLWITEGHYTWTKKPSSYYELKAGLFFHQHNPTGEVVNMETGNILTYDYGIYLVGDHRLFKHTSTNRTMSVFYQLAISPRNDNFGYIGAGCSFSGLLLKTGDDELGLAMAWGMLTSERGRDEIAFEITYKVGISKQIYLQPDIQYIINPGGSKTALKNATVGLLRFGMDF